MRFYYLTLTLFLQTLILFSLQVDAAKLSFGQIALIQNQGVSGIQTVFEESMIEIQDLPSVEAFASEVTKSQLSDPRDPESISEYASETLLALAEISISKNIKSSYVIEYSSAGIAKGLVTAYLNKGLDINEAIEAAAKGSAAGAILFSAETKTNINENASAAASGSLAGIIEITKSNGIDITQAVQACASGIIYGTINSAIENNSAIYESLASACEGVAEAAIEASVREELDLTQQITNASLGAGRSAVNTATSLSLEIDPTLRAIYVGLKRGTFDSIPGKGNNIRIMIAPQKNLDAYVLINAIENGFFEGSAQADYFPDQFQALPIIETPFEYDPVVRQVSPFN